MIVLDISVVVAFMNFGDDDHERAARWMEMSEEELLKTPLIFAEIGHLVSRAGGSNAARAFYEDLASGAYLVEWWPEPGAETVTAAKQHQDAGLADASLLALAGEAAFTLLPADA